MSREELSNRIVSVEAAYEFMLSYAARGMQDEGSSPIRDHLEKTAAALDGLGDAIRAAVAESGSDAPGDAGGATGPRDGASAVEPFIEVVEHDAAASRAAVTMVLGRATISSQIIDNLNASIHIRALLTDLFLVDEALELRVGETSPPAQFAPDEEEQFGPG